MSVIMQNEANRARPLRGFRQKKYDLEKIQGRSRTNRQHAPWRAPNLVRMDDFSFQLKSSALARGRQIDAVQNQRQLRTCDFQRVVFVQRLMTGQLIGSLLKRLIPDAKPGLSSIQDLDTITATIEEDKQASR